MSEKIPKTDEEDMMKSLTTERLQSLGNAIIDVGHTDLEPNRVTRGRLLLDSGETLTAHRTSHGKVVKVKLTGSPYDSQHRSTKVEVASLGEPRPVLYHTEINDDDGVVRQVRVDVSESGSQGEFAQWNTDRSIQSGRTDLNTEQSAAAVNAAFENMENAVSQHKGKQG